MQALPCAAGCTVIVMQCRLLKPVCPSAQVIGVGAAVLGDMSSRKDWGIHELDFVFSTLVASAAKGA